MEAVYTDCDRDTLLVRVHQSGVACHTGARTCFFTRLDTVPEPSGDGASGGDILDAVERVVQRRRVEPREGSYVARLLAQGDARILKKIGEESAEVIVAATKSAAEFLGAKDLGTLAPNMWADMIVLEKNPLEDIRNSRTIRGVYIAGNKVQ